MTGQELHDLRKRKGLTKTEAARLVGVHYKTMYKWEESGKLRSPHAYRLAEILESIQEPARSIITHPPRGEEITILRKAYGFSQEALADMVGVRQKDISAYEHGKEVPPDVSDSLCEWFGIRIRDENSS